MHPAQKQLEHPQVGVLRNTERQVERGDQADERLPQVFVTGAHALGVLVHHLAPIIEPADRAKAQGHGQHDPDKAVAQVEPQQCGGRDTQQNQHAAHGGRTAFAEVLGHAVAANRLADFERTKVADHIGAGCQAHQQGGQGGHHGPKGQVLKHPKKTELGRDRLQPLGKT